MPRFVRKLLLFTEHRHFNIIAGLVLGFALAGFLLLGAYRVTAQVGRGIPTPPRFNADTLDLLDSPQFLRSDVSDSFTSGTLTLDPGAALDVKGFLFLPSSGIFGAGSGSGLNADLVDSFHASAIPSPNTLLPLGPDAKFPISVVKPDFGSNFVYYGGPPHEGFAFSTAPVEVPGHTYAFAPASDVTAVLNYYAEIDFLREPPTFRAFVQVELNGQVVAKGEVVKSAAGGIFDGGVVSLSAIVPLAGSTLHTARLVVYTDFPNIARVTYAGSNLLFLGTGGQRIFPIR